MRESDAFTWRMEGDPQLRSTIVSIAWLAAAPDVDRIVERLAWATHLLPSFRMLVVEPPGRLAPPRWALSPDFDLHWHLRRVDAPAPHTPDTSSRWHASPPRPASTRPTRSGSSPSWRTSPAGGRP